jgi:hypothetical protein
LLKRHQYYSKRYGMMMTRFRSLWSRHSNVRSTILNKIWSSKYVQDSLSILLVRSINNPNYSSSNNNNNKKKRSKSSYRMITISRDKSTNNRLIDPHKRMR